MNASISKIPCNPFAGDEANTSIGNVRQSNLAQPVGIPTVPKKGDLDRQSYSCIPHISYLACDAQKILCINIHNALRRFPTQPTSSAASAAERPPWLPRPPPAASHSASAVSSPRFRMLLLCILHFLVQLFAAFIAKCREGGKNNG